MTIQPSVAIWTVICFCALYLILKNLLFRPVLKLMDEREKKIGDAAREKEDARIRAEEKQRLAAAARKEAEERALAERQEKTEALRTEMKKQLEDAKAEHFAKVEAFRLNTEAEFDAEMKEAEPFTERAAALFLSHLFEN